MGKLGGAAIRNILFICDVPESREDVGALLASHGYRLFYAKTVKEAVDLLATTPIDAAYMDLGPSCFQMLERMKHHLAGTSMVIAVDHLPDQSVQSMVFVQRPVTSEILLRILNFPVNDADSDDPQDWLHEINRSLRLENGRLQDAMAHTSHEWRNLVTQVDVLIAKMVHPASGGLSDNQHRILEQIQGVTQRMNQLMSDAQS